MKAFPQIQQVYEIHVYFEFTLFAGFSPPPPPPSPVRLCRSCLRRFGDLRKHTPLEFRSMYLVDLVNFHQFQGPPSGTGTE